MESWQHMKQRVWCLISSSSRWWRSWDKMIRWSPTACRCCQRNHRTFSIWTQPQQGVVCLLVHIVQDAAEVSALLCPLSGVRCPAVMDRVTWRGNMPPTAARRAVPWRRRGRRTATWTARSSSGNLERRTAWAARPQAATARDTSAGASWPIGGGRGSVSICFKALHCLWFCVILTVFIIIIILKAYFTLLQLCSVYPDANSNQLSQTCKCAADWWSIT